MSRVNKKGRNNGGGRFVQLHHFMMSSAAWRSLKPQDRAVYIEIATLYDGTNNGRLALGARDAAERANINKDTALVCFRRLQERGLIECAQRGGFSLKLKHSAEWRLTQYKCDRTGSLPSKGFMAWREGAEHGPLNSDRRSPGFGQCAPEKAGSVPSIRTEEAA